MDQASDQAVTALVARFTDRPLARITPDLLLFDDLGMDGDEAVEFFDAFAAAFPVDLTPLYARWGRYFGPEGWTLSQIGHVSLGVCYVAIPPIVFAAWIGMPRWLVVICGLIPFLIWMFPLRMWPLKSTEMCPISIRDLMTTAATGQWTTGSEPDFS